MASLINATGGSATAKLLTTAIMPRGCHATIDLKGVLSNDWEQRARVFSCVGSQNWLAGYISAMLLYVRWGALHFLSKGYDSQD